MSGQISTTYFRSSLPFCNNQKPNMLRFYNLLTKMKIAPQIQKFAPRFLQFFSNKYQIRLYFIKITDLRTKFQQGVKLPPPSSDADDGQSTLPDIIAFFQISTLNQSTCTKKNSTQRTVPASRSITRRTFQEPPVKERRRRCQLNSGPCWSLKSQQRVQETA